MLIFPVFNGCRDAHSRWVRRSPQRIDRFIYRGFDVTPGDATDLPQMTPGVMVTSAGDLAVALKRGDALTLLARRDLSDLLRKGASYGSRGNEHQGVDQMQGVGMSRLFGIP